MRRDIGAKTIMCPCPVLIVAAYGEDGKVQAMNAAWGGIADDHRISVCMSSFHATSKAIVHSKAFTVSFADAKHVKEADFLGIASGNKMPDKFERTGFHAVKSDKVDAPIIEEFPVCLECRLVEATVISDETYRIVGEIVNVSADEEAFDDDGVMDIVRIDPIVFDPIRREYYRLGTQVGEAYSVGRKLMEDKERRLVPPPAELSAGDKPLFRFSHG